jgi:uncharacterized protein DUF2786
LKKTPAEALDQASKLLALAVGSENEPEAISALKKCRKLAAAHGIKPADLQTASARVSGAEIFDKARAVATDPEVQKTAAMVGDAARGIGEAVGKIGDAAKQISGVFRRGRT